MPKQKLPPNTFHVSSNVLLPTSGYIIDPILYGQINKLQSEGRFRTALQVILNILDEKPNDESALRLAVVILGGGRYEHLQAKEPIPLSMRGDTRLDPIYTQCSHCNNSQWVSENWTVVEFALGLTVMDPIGVQCQECGYVMCRNCFGIQERPYFDLEILSKECPNCRNDTLGVPVYPTGRTSRQLVHRQRTLSRILIFREGPLVPDAAYLHDMIEILYPDALTSNIPLTVFPVYPWPEDFSTHAQFMALNQGIQLDRCDLSEAKDKDGNRLFFVRAYRSNEYPKPDRKTSMSRLASLHQYVQKIIRLTSLLPSKAKSQLK